MAQILITYVCIFDVKWRLFELWPLLLRCVYFWDTAWCYFYGFFLEHNNQQGVSVFINSKVNSNCHLFIFSLFYVRENQIESDRDAMFDGFYNIFDGT